MHFTDLFIKRPVLASVVSLLILALGLRSLSLLPVMQFPFTQNAVITVTTTYTGADPTAVAAYITTPLENAIAQASGIDYMTSTSTENTSTIQCNLLLNYDALKAVADITTKVNSVLNSLPKNSQLPTISVAIGESIDSMYIGFDSTILPNNKINDYLLRVVQPKLQAVPGVQNAQILGNRQFAMRAWIDPVKLAGFGLTADQVSNALYNNDIVSAAGRTDGSMVTNNISADTSLSTVDQFKNLIVKQQNDSFIRLKDVSTVSLGAQNYDTGVSFDGKSAIYIGIQVAPAANLLTVIDTIKKMVPDIKANLPNGLNATIVYDASAYVNSSIKEVIKSLVEAFIIVTVVIFLFLGSMRSVIIPMIAMPLSLIGAFFIMLLLGYSINLLTLLAMVLAIGLVVDDAIIVVENVQRHLEEGKPLMEAALIGARELAGPILAITVVLVAVYVPIGFMGGLTGALFTEFAFSLAAAVTVSAVIALTLSPMMCSKFLKIERKEDKKGLILYIDNQFEKLQKNYDRILNHSLNAVKVTLVFAIIILISNYFLFTTSQAELSPQEDQGIIIGALSAGANAALPQTKMYSEQMDKVFLDYKETDHVFQILGVNGGTGVNSLNSSIGGMVLKPWDQRKMTSNQLQPLVQNDLNDIAGAKIAAFQLPSLPGGGSGLPIQFVITTSDDFAKLNTVLQTVLDEARASRKFMYIDPDLKIDKAQTSVILNKDKIAELGLNLNDIGTILASNLSQGYVNYFNYAGRSYQVIPQVIRNARINEGDLLNYYINSATGISVPLSTVAKLKTTIVPESLNHFQQLNSATISAIALPGVSMGDALTQLQKIAAEKLPEGYSVDYAAQSRQYIQEGDSLIFTFFFALIIIFLSLAALFESFRDPLIVLISVPMSICGAMIFVSVGVGGASLNIYSEVGLVTLIGLISKHGILIVQFANDQQLLGYKKREAIQMAASIRLRPILMTTAAMVLGVIPLILANGAGAVSRYNIGLVIATGISIGTLFTLFVVPAMYLLVAQDHSKHAELDDTAPETVRT